MATGQSSISRAPRPSSLADVLDLILDKGLVIDAYVRVSALGIEVLTIDARIVIASVDTYLHFAEAVNRLDLSQTETQGIQGLTQGLGKSGAHGKVQGAIEGGKEALKGNGKGSNERQKSGSRRGSS
ncbi:MAG: gas vesicle protein [Actinomycetota bacterium]|nr:gas vesicle protein [Actinomycetota bacterium]